MNEMNSASPPESYPSSGIGQSPGNGLPDGDQGVTAPSGGISRPTNPGLPSSNDGWGKANAVRQSTLDDPNLGGGGPRGYTIPDAHAVETQKLFDKWGREATLRDLQQNGGPDAVASFLTRESEEKGRQDEVNAEWQRRLADVKLHGYYDRMSAAMEGQYDTAAAAISGRYDIAAERLRGIKSISRERLKGRNLLNRQALKNRGDLTRAQQEWFGGPDDREADDNDDPWNVTSR